MYIAVALLTLQVPAQKTVSKEVAYKGQKIQVALGDVDKIVLEHTTVQKVMVTMTSYIENPIGLTLKESNEYIYINSNKLALQTPEKVDKFCSEQPLFPTYKITIPDNAEVAIYYNNGDFVAEGFTGIVNLRLNSGTLDILNLQGSVAIELFSGNINTTVSNSTIDITTNRGKITSFIKAKKFLQTNTSLKGVYGKPIHKLHVRAIHANITLRPTKTQ